MELRLPPFLLQPPPEVVVALLELRFDLLIDLWEVVSLLYLCQGVSKADGPSGTVFKEFVVLFEVSLEPLLGAA